MIQPIKRSNNFFLIGLPCLLWTASLCFFIFSNTTPEGYELQIIAPYSWFFDMFKAIQADPAQLFFYILIIIVCFSLFLLFLSLTVVFSLFYIPIMMVLLKTFSLSGVMLWLLTVAIIWSFISSFKFKLGKLQKIEHETSTDSTAGGIFICNVFIILFRMVVILFFGFYIFLFQKSGTKN